MTAGIVPVHQTGLGRDADLGEHGAAAEGSGAVRLPLQEIVLQQAVDPGQQLLHAVSAAASAQVGRLTADQTGPGRQSQIGAGDGNAVGGQHVDIEQTADGAAVLHRHHGPFQLVSRGVQQPEGLVTGGFSISAALFDLPFFLGQSGFDQAAALVEAPLPQGGELQRARDVQGETDQGAALLQQFFLALSPPFPCGHHVRGSDFLLHKRRSVPTAADWLFPAKASVAAYA